MPVDPFELISHFQDGNNVVFVPNPGNAGDALIDSGTFSGFDKNKIIPRFFMTGEITDNTVLVYAGGGNLVSYYATARKIISKYHNKVKALIILPHTINGHSDLLKELGSNCHIFCREQVSYNYVKETARKSNVYLHEDLALSIDVARFMKYTKYSKAFFRLYYKKILALKVKKNPVGRELICFRKDIEAMTKAAHSIDVPHYFIFDYYTDANILNSISLFLLRYLNHYKVVRTNRLHVCIASALLGKKVCFYPNSYYKNKAVYEFSLVKYPNIIWKDHL